MIKKTWIFLAGFLMIFGAGLFVFAMSSVGWNFGELSTVKYETASYEISDDFDSVSVEAQTADVKILPSEDGAVRVCVYEKEYENHSVSVIDGVLTVKSEGKKSLRDYISISSGSSAITVYLPTDVYESFVLDVTTGEVCIDGVSFERIDVETTTGDVNISSATLGEVGIKVTTGDVKMCRVRCASVTVKGTTADTTFEEVTATGAVKIDIGTGDVKLADFDATEIEVNATTGDVTASLLSGKAFTVKTTTGKVSVPESVAGGACKITTTTGSVEITVKQ